MLSFACTKSKQFNGLQYRSVSKYRTGKRSSFGRGEDGGSEHLRDEEVGDLPGVAIPVGAVFPLAACDVAARTMEDHRHDHERAEPLEDRLQREDAGDVQRGDAGRRQPPGGDPVAAVDQPL